MKNYLKRTTSKQNFPKVLKTIKLQKENSNIINYKSLTKLQNTTSINDKSKDSSLSFSSISENKRKKNKNLIISKVKKILQKKKVFQIFQINQLMKELKKKCLINFLLRKKMV